MLSLQWTVLTGKMITHRLDWLRPFRGLRKKLQEKKVSNLSLLFESQWWNTAFTLIEKILRKKYKFYFRKRKQPWLGFRKSPTCSGVVNISIRHSMLEIGTAIILYLIYSFYVLNYVHGRWNQTSLSFTKRHRSEVLSPTQKMFYRKSRRYKHSQCNDVLFSLEELRRMEVISPKKRLISFSTKA